MKGVYTVSQVNDYVREMFEQDFLLRKIRVEGEVSNCKYHSSGHIYFSLKDKGGTLSCVMFSSNTSKLSFRLENGMQVMVDGRISVYPRDGKYQLYANAIEQAGLGILYERFIKLRDELQERGMFDVSYKKPIPAFAQTVGVVTASTGAAIHDIETVSGRRNPFVQIILCPAKVQGEGAAASIAAAIRRLSREPIDVMIVGRGGGSIEDLWAFNEEIVAEAIFECPIPIISAVGHETDTTIADYVSDLRAATPSAAAELAVFDYHAFSQSLSERKLSLHRSLSGKIGTEREKVLSYQNTLMRLSPESRLRDRKQDLIRLEDQLRLVMEERIRQAREYLSRQKEQNYMLLTRIVSDRKQGYLLRLERLKGLSPLAKLEGGYSYTSTGEGKALTSVTQVKAGDELTIHLKDGQVPVTVNEDKTNG